MAVREHAPPHLLHRLGTQVHAHILERSWPRVLDGQGFEELPEVMGFCTALRAWRRSNA